MVCLQVLTFSYTGLPTNNEPSEKTVRNLHCLFVSLYSWFKFLSFFVKSVEHIQGITISLVVEGSLEFTLTVPLSVSILYSIR